jgi:hypothetical protein
MQEDELRRVREYLVRYEIREREQRQVLRHEILTIADRDAAISAAVRAAIFGSFPSIVWSAVASFFYLSWPGGFAVLLAPLCFILPFVFVAAAAGVGGGLFAHWWFAGSTISVRRASITTALLSDAILFAWVVVLSRG